MKRNIKALIVAGALGAAALGAGQLDIVAPGAVHAGPFGADGSIADVAEKVTPSVVNISTTTLVTQTHGSPLESDPFFDDYFGGPREKERYGQSLGSGVIVSTKGYVLTNNHVVANAKDIKVSLNDGREVHATLVGADPKSDVAVLKLKGNVGNLKAIPFGDSDRLRLGDVVIAVGNPFGVGQTVTMGIVSAKGRANMGIVDYEDFIQTDAAINPGNSGGALINLRGELVGINTAILSRTGGSQGIGFAIPSGMAKPIMDSLIARGKVVRGWLGVSIQDVNSELAETLGLGVDHGVLIAGVVGGGPAAKAGLQRHDVVVRVGNRAVDKAANLRNAVAAAAVGKPVQVEFIRGNKRQTLSVVLGEMPRDDSVAQGSGQGSGGNTRLGLQVAPLSRSVRAKYRITRDVAQGVVVTGIARGSVADGIGLQAGDVIMQVNRTIVTTAAQLDQAYRQARGKLALLVNRDGTTVYVVVSK